MDSNRDCSTIYFDPEDVILDGDVSTIERSRRIFDGDQGLIFGWPLNSFNWSSWRPKEWYLSRQWIPNFGVCYDLSYSLFLGYLRSVSLSVCSLFVKSSVFRSRNPGVDVLLLGDRWGLLLWKTFFFSISLSVFAVDGVSTLVSIVGTRFRNLLSLYFVLLGPFTIVIASSKIWNHVASSKIRNRCG